MCYVQCIVIQDSKQDLFYYKPFLLKRMIIVCSLKLTLQPHVHIFGTGTVLICKHVCVAKLLYFI